MKTKKDSEYTFVNYPEPRTREDYANAMKKIIDIHKSMKEVIALYRFGSIGALGISDIDFFIVVNRDTKNFKYKFNVDRLSENEKYILTHYPGAILSEEILPTIQYIAPLLELECFYERQERNHVKQKIRKISKEEACIFLSDVLFMQYPGVFVKILEAKQVNVRHALTMLYSLRYSIDMFGLIGVQKNAWSDHIVSVNQLRDKWFIKEKKQNQEMLISLLNNAILICMDLINEFDQYYKKTYCLILTRKNEEKGYFVARNKLVLFRQEYNKENAYRKMQAFYKKNNIFLSILPMSIAEQLKVYSLSKTTFGFYIDAHLKFDTIREGQQNERLNEIRIKRCIAMS